MPSLKLKSLLVASPLETPAKRVQWILGAKYRRAHPELAELFLEEERLPQILRQVLTDTSNVIDVGCHIGSFLSLATKLSKKGHHVAIEASPYKAKWLERKFPSVNIRQVAISDYVGIATFEEDVANPGFSRLEGLPRASDLLVHKYTVNVTTLDSLLLDKADLIKLDIEGSELAALKGATRLIKSSRPAIVFECGADANPGMSRRELFDYLTVGLAYDVMTFTDFLFGKGPLSFDEFRKCGVYPFRAFNFVALPRN
jgi:FkbM family methyltransferase